MALKLEPNTYYILANGQLMRTFMEDGRGRMMGALYDEGDMGSPGSWEAFTWRLDGNWGAGGWKRLDVCEKIRSGASLVSYAKQHDFCASYDNDEPDDGGNMRQGFGATEIEAVMDLLQNYPGEERAEHMTRGRRVA